MLIFHKGHTDTIQVYSVTVMTHVKALQAGHSSQGTSEPITPATGLHRLIICTLYVVTKLLGLGYENGMVLGTKWYDGRWNKHPNLHYINIAIYVPC